MTYPTMAVANAFIKRAREGRLSDLSPMKLQKLLFFAQSWHLKWHGEPLIDDIFCRWKYGPVIPAIYHEFKHYRNGDIDRYGSFVSPYGAIEPIVPDNDKQTWGVIDEVIRAYGSYTGSQLSSITHQDGSAWHKTGGADDGPISNNDLARYIR